MRDQRGANSALSVDLPKGRLGELLGTIGNVLLWGRHMAPSQHSISCILTTHKCYEEESVV